MGSFSVSFKLMAPARGHKGNQMRDIERSLSALRVAYVLTLLSVRPLTWEELICQSYEVPIAPLTATIQTWHVLKSASQNTHFKL